MGEKFLEVKELELRPDGWRKYRYLYKLFRDYMSDVPVTQINYGMLEDIKVQLLARRKLASKIVYDAFGFIKSFLSWCKARGEITNLPNYPEVSSDMALRDILDKPTQAIVVEKVYELYWNHAPRACIAIELLCTYPKMRPGELRQVQEKHINLRQLTITIPIPKEKRNKKRKPKVVEILPEHGELIRSLSRGFPEMYFLRHESTVGGNRIGDRFGKNYLYQVWKKTCKAIGVKGVPLYPGTKHTTISDWARRYSEARIQQAAGVLSEAIRRYTVLGEEDCASLYQEARPIISDKILTKDCRAKTGTEAKSR
jgi:integrase